MNASHWRAWLGYGGLIPFIGLALVAWLTPPDLAGLAARAQVAYGAVILSFVGALHWGRGLALSGAAPDRAASAAQAPGGSDRSHALIWSVMPSLWAWIALLLATGPGLWMMAAGIAIAWAVDQRLYLADRDQAWHPAFLRMRGHLSATATVALIATALAPAAGG